MIRRLAYVIGAVVVGGGAAMLPPAVVSLLYREWSAAVAITLAAAITVGVGLVAWRGVGRQGELSTREGFATTGLAWIALALVGTLPYLLTGSIADPVYALFETTAGFTTTGSSIVPDPGELPRGVVIWRAMTQWLGGMGVIVLSVAVLPLLGVGGVQLARAEAPGPRPDRLTPRFRETAKRLWLLYVAFTAMEFVLLSFGDMTPFEALAHSFTTMPTGGFSTHPQSIGGFSAYSQWVIVVFMFVAGVSFALHFRALRRPIRYVRHPEWRLYATLCGLAVAGFVVGNWGTGSVEEVVRESTFNAVSLVTTTGYDNANFGAWASGLQIMAVGLMFLGGMAGSTAGAVKSFRIGVLTKAAMDDLRRLLYPRGIFITRFGRDPVGDDIVQSVQSFFLFYMFIFMTGTVVLGFIESGLGVGLDLVTSVSSVASALGNIGPGLGAVGPGSTYDVIPRPGLVVLSFLMIVGRLEIFPVLLLFTRGLWRR